MANKSRKRREFLNHIEYCGGARIHTEVVGYNYSVEIHSCHQSIDLHGSLRTKESLENAKFKMNTLIETLKGVLEDIDASLKEEKEKEKEKAANKKLNSKKGTKKISKKNEKIESPLPYANEEASIETEV